MSYKKEEYRNHHIDLFEFFSLEISSCPFSAYILEKSLHRYNTYAEVGFITLCDFERPDSQT